MDTNETFLGIDDIGFQRANWTRSDAPIAVATEVLLEWLVRFEFCICQNVSESEPGTILG